jgi:ubiquinone/menaquinone biosynthesis C-methylase UbiE
LDVGFGLGYGMNILAIKASDVVGVDIDPKVLDYCNDTLIGRNPRVSALSLYNGYDLNFENEEFDVVTCVDVLEHVEDYDRFLDELLRVSRKGVFISTPNRRPEHTNPDGTPRNYWHLREWTQEELDSILKRHSPKIDWYLLNGPWDGPFTTSTQVMPDSQTLSPFIHKT